MNIFDAHITGSLSVSSSAEISGDLTVLGTINATISGTTTNAISASHAASYTLTSSFHQFTSSYTTGSFTGSFKGDGAELYNIPASGVTGLNLTQIADGIVTASVSNSDGLRVNSNTEITGSLTTTGQISGSFKGDGGLLYNIPASGVTGLNLTQIADGTVTASISQISGFTVNTNTTISGDLIVSGNVTFGDTSWGTPEDAIFTASIRTHNTTYLGDMNTTVGDALIVSGGVKVSGSQLITNDLIVSGNVYFGDTSWGTPEDVIFTSSIKTHNTTYLGDMNTTVGDALIVSGGVNIRGTQIISNDLIVSGNVYFGNTEFGMVDDAIFTSSIRTHNVTYIGDMNTYFNDALIVTGNVKIEGNLSGSSLTGSIDYNNLTNTPTLVSNSLQIDITNTTNYTTFSSSISSNVSSSISELSSSVATTNLNQNNRIDSLEGASGSYATTGSNLFKGTQTHSGSIVPSVDNLYDLGSVTHQWRDVYISSGSLYIDGTKVISSTTQELTITTDNGQSLKILEGTTDSIVLQVADGDIELKSSGDGDILLDPTNGKIMLKGPVEVLSGQKIQSSVGGTPVVFANDIVVSGSIDITGTIEGINLTDFSSSVSGKLTSIEGITSSLSSFTSSASSRLSSIETSTSSLNSFTSSIDTTIKNKLNTEGVISGSVQVTLSSTTGYSTFSSSVSSSIGSLSSSVATTTSGLSSSIGSLSSSVATTNLNQNNRLDSIEGKSGSYATTGSNIFQGNQTITGSLYVSQNLIIAGSSSIQNISSSIVNIADNIITVNAQNPSLRFGGLAVVDSGSLPQVSGSMLFDSVNDQWIFVHQNQLNITSSILLMGPQTFNSLGNESYPTTNRILKSVNAEHVGDSNITDNGTNVSINSNTNITGSLLVTNTIVSQMTPLVSGSSQISYPGLSNIPSGIVSGSGQIPSLLPAGVVSGSSQVLNGTTIHSGTFFNGISVVSGSSQISFNGITDKPTLVSGSSQVLLGSSVWSGSAQLPSGIISGSSQLPSGLVSGSSQVDLTATTNYSTGIKTRLNAEGVISGSSQVLSGTGIWSGSAQLPSGVVSGSSQVLLSSGIWSGSAQLPSGVVSGSSQLTSTFVQKTGDTMTGQLVIGATGLAGSGTLKVNNSSASTFNHSIEAFAANMTAGQTNGIFLGQAGSTKNAGYVGYNWSSSASNSNYISLGHWGADNLFRVYGDGTVYMGTVTTGVWNGTAIAVANGGTGATDAATARTNLGLAIGTNVLAYRTFGTAANSAVSDFYSSTNPSNFISGISFANVSSKPTTISGYGITDAITTSNISSQSVSTSTYASYLNALTNYTWTSASLPQTYHQGITSAFVGPSAGEGSWQNYGSVMTMRTYSGGGGSLQLYTPYGPSNGGDSLQVRFGNYNVSSGNSWTGWKTLIDSGNIGSQTVATAGNATTAGGFTPSQTSGTANRIVVADVNGYIINNYFNASGGGSERNTSGMGYFAGHNTGDYYYRSYTAAAAAALLSGQSMNISGNATTATTLVSNATVSRDLYISGGAGGSLGNRLIIGGTSAPYTLEDTNVRPVIYSTGAYPVLTLNHTVSNGSHGPTIQFSHNTENKQWVIGSNGTGTQLDFGYSTNTSRNPHNGIDNYLGNTYLRISNSGNITTWANILPASNGTLNLGSSGARWSTIFTSDLSLSNGIGDYTIVEGENDLFLYNNKQNKVYKFMLQEVNPNDATPKRP